jgi:hypothetical protein
MRTFFAAESQEPYDHWWREKEKVLEKSVYQVENS